MKRGHLAPGLALMLLACGPSEPADAPVVEHQSPADEILRIGTVWRSVNPDRGFRSAPSPVAMFTSRTVSVVTLWANGASEELGIEERFELRDGQVYECQAEVKVELEVAYAYHNDNPAVELSRPALSLNRSCDPPGFFEPTLDMPASRSRFSLRSDQLLPYAPAREKRRFLPQE